MHNNFKQTKSKRTGQSPLKITKKTEPHNRITFLKTQRNELNPAIAGLRDSLYLRE